MPKNKGKGGKNRRRGKSDNDAVKREITFKEEGQGKCSTVARAGVVAGYTPSSASWRDRDETFSSFLL
jgi:translation initiation factor 1A